MSTSQTTSVSDGNAQPTAHDSTNQREAPLSKHPIDKFLAVLALISLLLNAYLVWDKVQHKPIAQPGPQISRLAMSGLSTNIVRALADKGELIANEFPKPRFVRTPAWEALISDLETLPPIRLRGQTYRFLVIQNRTASTYEDVSLRIGEEEESIADVGVLDGNSSLLVYYATEESIEQAEVTYRVRGASSGGKVAVPPRPRDSIEFLSEISEGDLRRFGDLEGNSERLNELINALRRSR